MNLRLPDVHKQLTKTYQFMLITSLLVITGVPAEALAFEATVTDPAPSFNFTPVHSKTSTLTTLTVSGPLPTYGYHSSGVALAMASPITVEGVRKPKPEPKKVVPVYPFQNPGPVVDQPQPLQPGEPVLTLVGEASYYSRAGCLGCSPNLTMANGQPLNDNALTMAIGADKKHLVGRQAKVTNLATGKSVVVRITDTGGFYKAKYGHRVADLTIATKTAIGMAGGVGQVQVDVF